MRRFLLFALLFPLPLFAQDLSQFEKILVPTLNQHTIYGANGSTFGTSFGVYSPQKAFQYYPSSLHSATAAQVETTYPSMQSMPVWEAPDVTAQGRFVFVQRDAIDLPFAALMTASDPTGVGTRGELPVVRERDTRTGAITLMNLAVEPILSEPDPSSPEHFHLLGWATRNTLRIYDWDSTGTLVVRVKLVVSAGQYARGEIQVPVNRRDFDDPTYPYYAIVDLQSAFSSYCYPGLHVACTSYDATLQITGNGSTRFYAFASTTDNRTNHVSVWTPR